MQPGVSPEEVTAGQAAAYRDPEAHRGVSLVLGAGNVGSLGPNDVLHRLFVEGKVVVLKANPVNDYLVEHWERALRALIDEGVLRIVRGGAAAGRHLVEHSLVDDVHVTGSDKTYEAIVFGPGEEGARRKAAGVRLVTKPVTAELGCVSPVDRRPRPVVREGPLLPGGPRRDDAREQRRVQLPHAAGARDLEALAAARGVPQRARVRALGDPDATPRTTRAPRERHAALPAAHPDARAARQRRRRSAPLDRAARHRRAGPPATSRSTWRRSAASWPRRRSTRSRPTSSSTRPSSCATTWSGARSPPTVLAHPTELADPLVGGRIDAAIASLRYGADRSQPVARDGLRVRHDHLGRVPGAHGHRHPVGHRRRRQRAHVRPTAEVGRRRTLPGEPHAVHLRHREVVVERRRESSSTSCSTPAPRASRASLPPPCADQGTNETVLAGVIAAHLAGVAHATAMIGSGT